jgi:hypothetical protein
LPNSHTTIVDNLLQQWRGKFPDTFHFGHVLFCHLSSSIILYSADAAHVLKAVAEKCNDGAQIEEYIGANRSRKDNAAVNMHQKELPRASIAFTPTLREISWCALSPQAYTPAKVVPKFKSRRSRSKTPNRQNTSHGSAVSGASTRWSEVSTALLEFMLALRIAVNLVLWHVPAVAIESVRKKTSQTSAAVPITCKSKGKYVGCCALVAAVIAVVMLSPSPGMPSPHHPLPPPPPFPSIPLTAAVAAAGADAKHQAKAEVVEAYARQRIHNQVLAR